MTVQTARPMQPPKTRACDTAPCAEASSLRSAASILVMIVAAEKERPTPSPKIAWKAYWALLCESGPVNIDIRPTPRSCRHDAPRRVRDVLFLRLEMAPPRNE